MGIKSNQTVRVVNAKTGKVSENIALYAHDPIWQKRTGNYPQPAPKAEDFKVATGNRDVKQETKKENNEATKTV